MFLIKNTPIYFTMHQSKTTRRKWTLNSTELLLLLLWTLFRVANSEQNITWAGSEITVTRNLNSLDYFEFWTDKESKSCSLKISTNVCEIFGGVEASKTNCKEQCCKRCNCRARSSFISQRQRCVPDSNITQLSGKTRLSSCICKLLGS